MSQQAAPDPIKVLIVEDDALTRRTLSLAIESSPELKLVAALECVNYVTIFPSLRVTDLVAAIRPQAYAKGGDYTVESLNPEERAALQAAGSAIHILPLVPGKSTTAIIEKWKN